MQKLLQINNDGKAIDSDNDNNRSNGIKIVKKNWENTDDDGNDTNNYNNEHHFYHHPS